MTETLTKNDYIWWKAPEGFVRPEYWPKGRLEQAGQVISVNNKDGTALITWLDDRRHPVTQLVQRSELRRRGYSS